MSGLRRMTVKRGSTAFSNVRRSSPQSQYKCVIAVAGLLLSMPIFSGPVNESFTLLEWEPGLGKNSIKCWMAITTLSCADNLVIVVTVDLT
jgi:hypothetical protein